MALNPTSPIPGGDITGITTPTYTISERSNVPSGREWIVTAVNGTGWSTTPDAHTNSSPFMIGVYPPRQYSSLPPLNSQGQLPSIPKNKLNIKTVKGCDVLAGQPEDKVIIRTEIVVPAGADSVDDETVKAALSAHIGFLKDQDGELATGLIQGDY